jgi:hypothetical protein
MRTSSSARLRSGACAAGASSSGRAGRSVMCRHLLGGRLAIVTELTQY